MKNMTKIEIKLSDKIFRIECSACTKTFIKTFDELAVLGIVKCTICGEEHFIASIK